MDVMLGPAMTTSVAVLVRVVGSHIGIIAGFAAQQL
jgi:hypothetical protein